ncbi:hypothetical protein KAH27_03565 [bacterium]|nr:hypothetical protein [bacterium]
MKNSTIKLSILIFFIMFIQSCGIFKCGSQNHKLVPTKSYFEVFGEESYMKYPTVSKSFFTPRIQEMCIRDFMRVTPSALFRYNEARWDLQNKYYYYFFSFCFRNEVCYAYDANKDKLIFKVFISPLLLDDEEKEITVEDIESVDEDANKEI